MTHKEMTSNCVDCQFRGSWQNLICCDYILITGHMRPCPPGDLCMVKVVGDKIPLGDGKISLLRKCPVCGAELWSLHCTCCGRRFASEQEVTEFARAKDNDRSRKRYAAKKKAAVLRDGHIRTNARKKKEET